jgi:hypothetical protein
MKGIKALSPRIAIYVLIFAFSFTILYRASLSWSAEALNLDFLLMPMYFFATVFLFLIIVSNRIPLSLGDKLALTLIHSFLTRVVSIIFFYPGTSGDNTYHLAHERTFSIFGKYYMLLNPIAPPETRSIIGRLFVFHRASIQYGLVTSLSKVICIDVFWVHLFLVAALWSFFIPIIGFKIAKTLGTNDRVALLAAALTASAPMIIGWSYGTVPNSLGFFFFVVTLYFLVKSLTSKNTSNYILLTLLATVVSLLTHSLTGITAVTMVLLAFSIKKYSSLRRAHSTTASSFLALSFLTCVMLVPVASVLMYLVYPTYSSYSLQKIFSYDIYHIVLANYADYTAAELLTYGTITILAIIGMVIHSRRSNKKNLNLFMILAFILIIAEYRVNLYFCTKPLFGLHRILTFEPFITAPFAAITINYLVAAAKPAASAQIDSKNPKHNTRFKLKFPSNQIIVTLLICLGLAALIVEGDLTNFRGLGFAREPYGINSVYSTEAARLIHEEYLRTQEKYAVVTDPVSEGAGMALIGRYDPDEFYLFKYEGNLDIFLSLLRDLSTESLLNATQYNGATLVYVIISKWSVTRYLGPRADFYQVMGSLSRLLGPPFAIVGEGDRQVYVFSFRAEYATGTGPRVIVYKDLQQVSINTTYSFINLENVTYQLNVTGATNYGITGWPMHWSYEQIRPLANASIDSNAWINFTGSPTANYTIEWTANEYYPKVVWKDDSFLQEWRYTGRVGNYSFTTDGDIATESVYPPLIEQDWVNYEKELPSLQNCTILLARLKGDVNSIFSILVWQNKTIILSSGHKTATTEFKTYTFTLPNDATPTRIWITTITPYGNPANIYWDYIMFTQD